MKIAYSKAAAKYLMRLPPDRRLLIVEKIEAVLAGKRGDVKPMQGVKGVDRLRVGDFRVLMKVEAGTLHVLAVGPRGDIYK